MQRKHLSEFFAAPLIFLFAYSAITKLADLRQFSNDMRNQPFPLWFANMLTWLVPAIELLACAALLFTSSRKAGWRVSLVLMMLFTAYTAAVLFHFFPRVPCSCGGVIREFTWTQHLFLNLLFLLIATAGNIFHGRETGYAENLQKRVSNLSS